MKYFDNPISALGIDQLTSFRIEYAYVPKGIHGDFRPAYVVSTNTALNARALEVLARISSTRGVSAVRLRDLVRPFPIEHKATVFAFEVVPWYVQGECFSEQEARRAVARGGDELLQFLKTISHECATVFRQR